MQHGLGPATPGCYSKRHSLCHGLVMNHCKLIYFDEVKEPIHNLVRLQM